MTHSDFMRRAIELADFGWGRVHPNPLVGAVVVKDGVVVGEGWHREYGSAHAEPVALIEAGDRAQGATLYVSLEPCTHQGKTPPCTDAIVRAGVATVVYGADDPNPKARGGAAVLRDAGINVIGGVEAEAVRHQNAIFFQNHTGTRPFVALKLAMSIDGRIAAAAGERTKLTSDEADREVHRLRSGYDAIMIGVNTARVDDPLLTVRLSPPSIRPPVRLVLDSSASLPIQSALMKSIDEAGVWIIAGADAPGDRIRELEQAGARVLRFKLRNQKLPLLEVLEALKAEEITSVFCEGGAAVAGGLLADDVVDRMYLFVAPRLLGPDAVSAFATPNLRKNDAWRTRRIAQLGPDALLMLDRERGVHG